MIPFRIRREYGGFPDSSAEREFRRGLEKVRDDERVVDTSNRGYAVAVADPDPLEAPPVTSHRSGTCFDVESTEMRAACVSTIRAHLGADVVVHEVRHQRSAYHTDLVFAVVDAEAVRERSRMVVGDDPIHDPLQRFRVWWYIAEYGPKSRTEAVDDGKYADPSTNRAHVDWLLNHGYLAQTSTGHLVAVEPPEIAELHAVELKLRNWEKALEQAERANRADVDEDIYGSMPPRFFDRYGYADYRWVALDAGAIENALENRDAFEDEGVGLLAVAEGGTVVEHVDADHDPRGRYTRDRAYVESQVWNRIDLDVWLEKARPDEEMAACHVAGGQHSLSSFSGGED